VASLASRAGGLEPKALRHDAGGLRTPSTEGLCTGMKPVASSPYRRYYPISAATNPYAEEEA